MLVNCRKTIETTMYACRKEKFTCLATLRRKRPQTISCSFLTWPISFFFHSEKATIWKKTGKILQKGDIIAGLSLLYLATRVGGIKQKNRLKAQQRMIHFFCFIFPSTGTKCELQYIVVYLGIHAYQRNLGSLVTVRMSAPPVRKTAPKFD